MRAFWNQLLGFCSHHIPIAQVKESRETAGRHYNQVLRDVSWSEYSKEVVQQAATLGSLSGVHLEITSPLLHLSAEAPIVVLISHPCLESVAFTCLQNQQFNAQSQGIGGRMLVTRLLTVKAGLGSPGPAR